MKYKNNYYIYTLVFMTKGFINAATPFKCPRKTAGDKAATNRIFLLYSGLMEPITKNCVQPCEKQTRVKSFCPLFSKM